MKPDSDGLAFPVGVALLVLLFWLLDGGLSRHCEAHPGAVVCEFIFGYGPR